MNVYSKAPTGRPELSASVGIKGLQPVIRMSMGMSWSCRTISANGKRDVNCPLSKRGMPRSVCPFPRPDLGRPNFFQSGHLISRTLEPFFTPFRCMAANMPGSLKKSMWWRTDIWETAPGPFQAEHAGSHSSDRECHTVEEFAGIRSVVVPLSESMEGDAQAEDADENLFHVGLLSMLKFGEGYSGCCKYKGVSGRRMLQYAQRVL